MEMAADRIEWDDLPVNPGGAKDMAPPLAPTLAMALSVLIHGTLMAVVAWMPPPAFSPPGSPAQETIDVRLVPGEKAPPVQTAQPTASPSRRTVPPVKKPMEKSVPRKSAVAATHKPATESPTELATETAAPPSGSQGGSQAASRAASWADAPSPDPAALSRIMARLRRFLVYPRQARRRGWEGETLMEFRLTGNGRIEKIRIARGSGYPILDRAALEALGKIRSIPAEKGWRAARDMDVTIPVVFRLTE